MVNLNCPKSDCSFEHNNLDDFIDHVKTHGVKTPGIEKVSGTYKVIARSYRD